MWEGGRVERQVIGEKQRKIEEERNKAIEGKYSDR